MRPTPRAAAGSSKAPAIWPLSSSRQSSSTSNKVGVGGERRRLVDNQQAFKAAAHQLGRFPIDARAIAEQAGIGQLASIVEGAAGRDRRLRERRDAFHRVVAAQPVPVDGRGLIELVKKADGEFFALPVAQKRARGDAVEAENVGFGWAGEARFAGPRFKRAQARRRRLSPRGERQESCSDAGEQVAAGEAGRTCASYGAAQATGQ